MSPAITDLITHLRAKARYYSDMANTVEREASELEQARPTDNTVDIAVGSKMSPTGNKVRVAGLPTGEATVINVKAYLNKKKARIRDLALHFGVNEDEIRKMVDDRFNGIVIGDRGWLRCDVQQALTFTPEEENALK